MQFGIIRTIGVILFLYLTWRNSREDFEDDKLISYSWVSLLAFLIGGRLAFGLINWGVWNDSIASWFLVWQKPGMNYMGGYLVWFMASWWYANNNKWKVWSFMEDSIVNFGVMMAFFIGDELLRSNFNLTAASVLMVLMIIGVLTMIVSKKYRSYVWYKSGKKGFIFFFTNVLFWLFLALKGVLFKDGYFISGIYLTVGLISLIGLFILGEVLDIKFLNVVGMRRKNEK
ncbi:MAG: prolipoprotein diacylglyceryl transferase family protein [Patescibacteria group bacterium]|jgi:hypothetical protein